MLFVFFVEMFELLMVIVGLLVGMYVFMNLMLCFGGGIIFDCFGCKKILFILIVGLVGGYFILSYIDVNWLVWLVVLVVMVCLFFVQLGEGVVFVVVLFIKCCFIGQIVGMIGVYGNVGVVIYLIIYFFVDVFMFFLVISGIVVFGFIVLFFMKELSGVIIEVNEDGIVELIYVG